MMGKSRRPLSKVTCKTKAACRDCKVCMGEISPAALVGQMSSTHPEPAIFDPGQVDDLLEDIADIVEQELAEPKGSTWGKRVKCKTVIQLAEKLLDPALGHPGPPLLEDDEQTQAGSGSETSDCYDDSMISELAEKFVTAKRIPRHSQFVSDPITNQRKLLAKTHIDHDVDLLKNVEHIRDLVTKIPPADNINMALEDADALKNLSLQILDKYEESIKQCKEVSQSHRAAMKACDETMRIVKDYRQINCKLTKALDNAEAEVRKIKRDAEHAALKAYRTQLNQMKSQTYSLNSQVTKLEQKRDRLSDRIKTIEKQRRDERTRYRQGLREAENKHKQITSQLTAELSQIREELATQKENYESKITKLEKNNKSNKKAVSDAKKIINTWDEQRSELQIEVQGLKQEVQRKQDELKSKKNKYKSIKAQLKEATANVEKLQTQNEKYKEEELKWRSKRESYEKECSQARKDIDRLKAKHAGELSSEKRRYKKELQEKTAALGKEHSARLAESTEKAESLMQKLKANEKEIKRLNLKLDVEIEWSRRAQANRENELSWSHLGPYQKELSNTEDEEEVNGGSSSQSQPSQCSSSTSSSPPHSPELRVCASHPFWIGETETAYPRRGPTSAHGKGWEPVGPSTELNPPTYSLFCGTRVYPGFGVSSLAPERQR